MADQASLDSKVEIPATQAQILEAAIICVKRWGIERVTLNDIAYEARVARSTVYSYYGNRDEVVKAGLLQSAYAFGEKLLDHLTQFESSAERAIEAIAYSLEVLPNEPYLALITDDTLSNMVREQSLTAPEGADIGAALFKVILHEENYPEAEMQEMFEFTFRFMLSLLTMETVWDRRGEELRGFVARRVLPSLGLSVPPQYDVYRGER